MQVIQAVEVLERLGFVPAQLAGGHGHSFNRYGLHLEALACVSKASLQDAIFVSGTYRDSGRLAMITFETPTVFESFEQGVAWLAEGIGRRVPYHLPVEWLGQGRRWRDLLPWIRVQAAYAARPRCTIERDWFRLPSVRLRALAENAEASARAVFSFDGRILTIHAQGTVLPAPGVGSPWPQTYAVRLSHLCAVPKRLMNPFVEIGIWEGRMTLGRYGFRLATSESSDE